MPADLRDHSLTRRLYVVAGGAGVAGGAVVEALLRRGATVAVPSRSKARVESLDRSSPGLRAYLVPDLPEPLAATVATRDSIIGELGPIDGVVASLGAWWEGSPLLDLSPAEWHRLVTDNLTSHFVAARAYLPVLLDRPDAVYVALAGIAADLAVAGSGPISVTGAGQRMLLRVLAAELRGRVRLHEVTILTPVVTPAWDPDKPVEPDWLSGTEVGSYLADVVTPGFAGQLLLSLPPDFVIPSDA
jgi:NAD(P)-dependent dehydrogenase (short-subunit alcohol dehydrogenase family)